MHLARKNQKVGQISGGLKNAPRSTPAVLFENQWLAGLSGRRSRPQARSDLASTLRETYRSMTNADTGGLQQCCTQRGPELLISGAASI